jgi:hypothetical protein
MKLVQIKEFSKENISQEMGEKLFSIVAMERYYGPIGQMRITEIYTYGHYDIHGKRMGGSNVPGHARNYIECKELDSVVITFDNRPNHTIYLDNNGRAVCHIKPDTDDMAKHMYPSSPDQVMGVYLEYGFYSVDIVEKLKELYPTIHYIINDYGKTT